MVQWSARGPLLKLVYNAHVNGWRLGVKQFIKPPHSPRADEGLIPQQSTFFVFDVLRVNHPLPFLVHPLEEFVETKEITFLDTPFELSRVIIEKPLYSFRPRPFWLIGGRLQC